MKRETLKQYRDISREIAILNEEHSRLAAGIIGAVKINGLPGGSAPGDPAGDIATRLADIEEQIAAKIDELTLLLAEIKVAIYELDSSRERQIMIRRYLWGEGWTRIAHELHFSRERILQIHREALQKICQK